MFGSDIDHRSRDKAGPMIERPPIRHRGRRDPGGEARNARGLVASNSGLHEILLHSPSRAGVGRMVLGRFRGMSMSWDQP